MARGLLAKKGSGGGFTRVSPGIYRNQAGQQVRSKTNPGIQAPPRINNQPMQLNRRPFPQNQGGGFGSQGQGPMQLQGQASEGFGSQGQGPMQFQQQSRFPTPNIPGAYGIDREAFGSQQFAPLQAQAQAQMNAQGQVDRPMQGQGTMQGGQVMRPNPSGAPMMTYGWNGR